MEIVSLIMNELNQKIKTLEHSTLSRLLSINNIIRENRNRMTKDSLNYYKSKRKEVSQSLSKIQKFNHIQVFKLDYDLLKQSYMTFEIKDPILL